MKVNKLEIKNYVGDHAEVIFNGDKQETRSFNSVVLAFCRFFDADPAMVAETCTIIKPDYEKALATYGKTNA